MGFGGTLFKTQRCSFGSPKWLRKPWYGWKSHSWLLKTLDVKHQFSHKPIHLGQTKAITMAVVVNGHDEISELVPPVRSTSWNCGCVARSRPLLHRACELNVAGLLVAPTAETMRSSTGKWYPSKGATLLWAAGVRLAWVYKYRDDPSVFKIASILFGVQNIGGYWGILGVFSMIMYDHWDSYHLRMNWNHWLSGSWVVGGISSAINQWPVQVQRKDIESRSQMWQTECLGLGTSAGEPSFLGGPNWVDPRINQDFCLGVSIESRIF